MSVDFLDHSLHEFLRVWLPNRLLKIHDITYHLSVESNRVSHMLLQFKVGVVEEVFISFVCAGFMCHVVETLCD